MEMTGQEIVDEWAFGGTQSHDRLARLIDAEIGRLKAELGEAKRLYELCGQALPHPAIPSRIELEVDMTDFEKPKRIQLSRKKGWRMPLNTIKVSRPSKWGNPFRITKLSDAEMQVAQFRFLMDGNGWRRDQVGDLRGKNLACWCKLGEPCHADVLLEIAND